MYLVLQYDLKEFYFHFRSMTAVKSRYCKYVLGDFCYPSIQLSVRHFIRTLMRTSKGEEEH